MPLPEPNLSLREANFLLQGAICCRRRPSCGQGLGAQRRRPGRPPRGSLETAADIRRCRGDGQGPRCKASDRRPDRRLSARRRCPCVGGAANRPRRCLSEVGREGRSAVFAERPLPAGLVDGCRPTAVVRLARLGAAKRTFDHAARHRRPRLGSVCGRGSTPCTCTASEANHGPHREQFEHQSERELCPCRSVHSATNDRGEEDRRQRKPADQLSARIHAAHSKRVAVESTREHSAKNRSRNCFDEQPKLRQLRLLFRLPDNRRS